MNKNFEYPTLFRPPSVQHRDPSIPHKKLLSSTPKTPQFNIKIPQFHTPLSSTQFLSEGFLVWNQRIFCVEVKGLELRGSWCWTEGFLVWIWGVCGTEGFLVWNWGVFGVELKDLRAEKEWSFCVELMCWTEGDQKIFVGISHASKKSRISGIKV